MQRKGEVIKEGNDPKCKHERTREAGHGTVTYFEECVDCGATISYFTGHDPYLAELETSREPPDNYIG